METYTFSALPRTVSCASAQVLFIAFFICLDSSSGLVLQWANAVRKCLIDTI